jgi:hypothetical protein
MIGKKVKQVFRVKDGERVKIADDKQRHGWVRHVELYPGRPHPDRDAYVAAAFYLLVETPEGALETWPAHLVRVCPP